MRRSGSLRTLTIYLTTTTIALIAPAVPRAAGGCAPGTTCLSVQENGAPGPGPSTAQCSGRFPDFVVPTTMARAPGLGSNYPRPIPRLRPLAMQPG